MRRATLLLSIFAVSGLLLNSGNPFAQSADKLIGTWADVSNLNIAKDGSQSEIFGANPSGLVMFQPNGRFMVIYTRAELPRFASGNRMQGTPEENKAIVQGTFAMFGTYSVEGKTLTLHVAGGTWPSWTGTTQTAEVTFRTDDEMAYAIPNTIGGKSVNTLKRVK